MAAPIRSRVTEADRRHFDFVQMLQRVSEELTMNETYLIKLYCSHVIPKGIAERLTQALEVFNKLIELKKIDQENLDFLEEVLKRMGRPDLVMNVLRPFQPPNREIPENPELEPGTSTDGASADGDRANAYFVIQGQDRMTQETVNRHRYNLRSLGPIEASDIMFRGYRAGNSILVHYTIPRESTAVLRLMATYSDPRLVFMGVTSLQIDAEPPIRVIQEELFNDIKRQRTVDDFEVGCSTRTKQKRTPRNWTRLSALNLFSDALPLHLQVAASLEYQGFSYSLVQGLMQKDQLREQEKSQLIQKAEVDSKTIMTLRSKLNISENMLKEALEANAVLEKKLQQAREFAEKAAKQVTSHVTEYRGEKATRTTGDFRPDKITYGGLGSEPGKFVSPYGVVVSSSNEIFVTDGGNRRVQVHTTEGVYLRHFLTVVPGTEDKDMWPHDVSVDGNGTLWVVGKGESADYVVQYSTDGTAMTQFHLQKISEYRVIAVDMRNNHIMVTDADRGEVEVFRPDGSLVRRFGHPEGGMRRPRHITVDGEGNILVSDWFTHSVYMYDESGKFLLKFGGEGSGEGQLQYPNGICTDSSGHIIVADFENQRVQMFTRHGDYIRSFVTGLWAEGVAVGPEGQLVVTEYDNDSVTIFPSCR